MCGAGWSRLHQIWSIRCLLSRLWFVIWSFLLISSLIFGFQRTSAFVLSVLSFSGITFSAFFVFSGSIDAIRSVLDCVACLFVFLWNDGGCRSDLLSLATCICSRLDPMVFVVYLRRFFQYPVSTLSIRSLFSLTVVSCLRYPVDASFLVVKRFYAMRLCFFSLGLVQESGSCHLHEV